MTITFKTEENNTSDYHNEVIIKNFTENGYTSWEVKKFLALTIYSPVILEKKNIILYNWKLDFNIEILEPIKISENYYIIQVKIYNKNYSTFTMQDSDQIILKFDTCSGYPSLAELSNYRKLYKISKDEIINPCGKLILNFYMTAYLWGQVIAPIILEGDNGLKIKQYTYYSYLYFDWENRYKPRVHIYNLPPGTYKLYAKPYIDVTQVTSCIPKFYDKDVDNEIKQITITRNEESNVDFTLTNMKSYSSRRLTINPINDLKDIYFYVTANIQNKLFSEYIIKTGYQRLLPRFPEKENLFIIVHPHSHNNKNYYATMLTDAQYKWMGDLTVHKQNFIVNKSSPYNLLKLEIVLLTPEEFQGKFHLIKLISKFKSYSASVELINNRIVFPVDVYPGEYKISCSNFIINKTVYAVVSDKTINISQDQENIISLNIRKGANLSVRGFENKLSFGGYTTLEMNNLIYYANNGSTSICGYAGKEQNGDPSILLNEDENTLKTIKLANNIELYLKEKNIDKKIIPIMVSYTVDLLNNDINVLQNEEYLKTSFANYILTLHYLNKNSNKGSVILNPNMLDFITQNNISYNYTMPVKKPLKEALYARKELLDKDVIVPEYISEDIKGYILAINWLTHTIAPDITYGWHINVTKWFDEKWVYDKTPDIEKIVDFRSNVLRTLGVTNGEYKPDFLAIDRFDADDLTSQAYKNKICYGPKEWDAYFDFCSAISLELQIPIMPWQVPASRTPTIIDIVADDFDKQRWGTAASYIFGDEIIGGDVNNINSTIRDFSFIDHNAEALAELVGNTAGDMYAAKPHFDIYLPAYKDFALKGIFHVQLGGRNSLGMVPPAIGDKHDVDLDWINEKLEAYAKNPVTFEDTI